MFLTTLFGSSCPELDQITIETEQFLPPENRNEMKMK
jgi:hypothetical protein